MLVREAMTTDVVTVRRETTLHDAARLLTEHGISSMPVVDAAGYLVGIISEADVVRDSLVPDQRAHLLRVPVQGGPRVSKVEDVMTGLPLVVRPGDDLADAVQMMSERAVKSLPVVQEGHVVGMVSRADVVRQLARRDERVRGDVEAFLRLQGLDWSVEVLDGVVVLDGPRDTEAHRVVVGFLSTVRGVTGIRSADAAPQR